MSATVQVTDVAMPGMFSTKNDDEGVYWADGDAYEPMPYALGEVCLPCWHGPRPDWWHHVETAGLVDWCEFDDAFLRAVGHAGCTHGGAS